MGAKAGGHCLLAVMVCIAMCMGGRADEVGAAGAGAATRPVSGAVSGPTTERVVDLGSGWGLIEEGSARGTIRTHASRGGSTSPNVVYIGVTRTADPGEGRAGAKSDKTVLVERGEWFDVRFLAVNAYGSTGMVFSLESARGEVLARTTLPEIGRGRFRRLQAATRPGEMQRGGADGVAGVSCEPACAGL